jgi:endonuclease G
MHKKASTLLLFIILLVAIGSGCITWKVPGPNTARQTANRANKRRAADKNGVAPSSPELNLALGNPSKAKKDSANSDNFLVEKPQFALSYNRSKGGPNWVSWHIGAGDLGNTKRPKPDPFAPDMTLPASWQIKPTDYHFTETQMERGHMCPSADRSANIDDMKATFVMSNMLPQAVPLNEEVWARLEEYERRLIRTNGKELYVLAGGIGSKGMIRDKVNIPEYCWKIVVILDEGDDDLSGIDKDTRVIAVIMPNDKDLDPSTPWTKFITTVDDIEAKTGYDFLSNVSIDIQTVIEAGKDTLGAQ